MCVSGVRSRVVSCERVRVSCEWASRRSSVVRREAFSFAFVIPKFSCRMSNSSFSFEFAVEIFVSNFEFKFLEFSCRISNSSFSFRCSIRFLEFRCSVRFLEFHFSIRVSSSSSLIFFVSNLSSKFSCRISNSSFSLSCSIRFLEFRFESFVALFDFSNFEFSIRVLDSSALNFEFVFFVVLIYSTSRICRRNCCLRAEFFIWVLNWTIQFSFSSPILLLNCHLTSSIILALKHSLRSRCHASFARAFRA